jgi:hypothetical protein
LIAVLTDPAVGGTFVTWSLHYLAGHDSYFVAKDRVWASVTDFPLTKINSHNFQANHPLTAQDFDGIFDILCNTPTDQFHTIYIHNFIHNSQSADPELAQRLQQVFDHSQKVVVVSNSSSMALYHVGYRSRSGTANLWQDPGRVSADHDEIFADFVDHFFAESHHKWRTLGLDDIWDRREFIALNFDFEQHQSINDNIGSKTVNYTVTTLDLWNTFDQTVVTMFDHFGIEICQARWHNWTQVYQQWRQLHYQRQQFAWYFDSIVDGIIQGQDIDLTRFELDIVQEAAIQNQLIRKHNLNLKTWQLERFSNTQQLHDLLETNYS